jgi:hypothetical protein
VLEGEHLNVERDVKIHCHLPFGFELVRVLDDRASSDADELDPSSPHFSTVWTKVVRTRRATKPCTRFHTRERETQLVGGVATQSSARQDPPPFQVAGMFR